MNQAIFLQGCSNCRLLRNKLDETTEKPVKYVVERTIYLRKENFTHFRQYLLEDNINIQTYKNEMYIDEKGIWHVILFCSLCFDTLILVNSDGENFAKYASIISNGEEQIDKNFTLKNRYRKS